MEWLVLLLGSMLHFEESKQLLQDHWSQRSPTWLKISSFTLLELWAPKWKKLQCLLKKSSQICKHARKGVLMVASNSFSIYFWYIKNKYCNSHPKFLSLLQFLSVVPRSAKLLRGRKCIISLPLLPVFCINPAVAKFEWKIIPLPFGNVHDSWPKRII